MLHAKLHAAVTASTLQGAPQGMMRAPAFFISSTSFLEASSMALPSMKIWQ